MHKLEVVGGILPSMRNNLQKWKYKYIQIMFQAGLSLFIPHCRYSNGKSWRNVILLKRMKHNIEIKKITLVHTLFIQNIYSKLALLKAILISEEIMKKYLEFLKSIWITFEIRSKYEVSYINNIDTAYSSIRMCIESLSNKTTSLKRF